VIKFLRIQIYHLLLIFPVAAIFLGLNSVIKVEALEALDAGAQDEVPSPSPQVALQFEPGKTPPDSTLLPHTHLTPLSTA
jgi:hypothetical protein